MAGAARANTISWGGLTMGAGTNYDLHDYHAVETSYGTLIAAWTVIIRDATESGLITKADALKTALRTPNSTLTVNLNGQAYLSAGHSANTGFNGRGFARLDPYVRSNNSQTYQCRVELQLPADEAGKGYRASSDVRISKSDQGLTTVVVAAHYTAGGNNSATENVDDGFATFLASVLPTISGEWDTTDHLEVHKDSENKNADVLAVRREIRHEQSAEGIDDPDFVGSQVSFETTRPETISATGSGALGLTTIVCRFRIPVRWDRSTDLKGLFLAKVLPELQRQLLVKTDTFGAVVEQAETYAVDPTNNVLSGAVTFAAERSSLVFATKVVSDEVYLGRELVPLSDVDRPYLKVLHQGPRRWVRQISISTLEIGNDDQIHRRFVEEAEGQLEREGFVLLAIVPSQAEPFTATSRSGASRSFMRRSTTLASELADFEDAIQIDSTSLPEGQLTNTGLISGP